MDSGFKKKKRGLMSEDNLVIKRRNNNNQEDEQSNKYGDGMAWFRGCLIGKGCFGSVFLANLKKPKSRFSFYPPIMAVKSAEVSVSSSIQKEREVLNNIRGSRNVIRCFGEELTNGDNGQMVYNLLLEYGSGGTLARLIDKSRRNGLPEMDVKRHTRSILRGLCHIHKSGYVHCDLKPENIMIVGSLAKIGDLGLAKRANCSKESKKSSKMNMCNWRGTPMYFSPEVVIECVQEAPSDIWALGCIVLEMLTANPPWDANGGEEIVARIRETNESPLIPSTLSREAKSFLKGCFSRKAMYRWTAEMLLAHPFLEGIDDEEEEDDDDNKEEESGEVLDINAISSLIMSENEDDDDDEISLSSFSDGLYSWSEEEVGNVGNDTSSCFTVETSTTSPLNEVHQYPITFTIS